jgi:hypothetical protein
MNDIEQNNYFNELFAKFDNSRKNNQNLLSEIEHINHMAVAILLHKMITYNDLVFALKENQIDADHQITIDNIQFSKNLLYQILENLIFPHIINLLKQIERIYLNHAVSIGYDDNAFWVSYQNIINMKKYLQTINAQICLRNSENISYEDLLKQLPIINFISKVDFSDILPKTQENKPLPITSMINLCRNSIFDMKNLFLSKFAMDRALCCVARTTENLTLRIQGYETIFARNVALDSPLTYIINEKQGNFIQICENTLERDEVHDTLRDISLLDRIHIRINKDRYVLILNHTNYKKSRKEYF